MRLDYKMYIDDLRFPKTPHTFGPDAPIANHWLVVRSSQEAIDYVLDWGVPSEISFDHDLGGDDTSIQFIKWLIEYTMDHTEIIFPVKFNVHSANPVGAENITHLMNNFIDHLYGEL